MHHGPHPLLVEISEFSELQLIKRCKAENVWISSSKMDMINGLLEKWEKKHKPKKSHIKKTMQKNKCKSKSVIQLDQSKLITLFQTTNDPQEFYQFITSHAEQFVITVIDIILNKSANSNDETDLSTMLFHEFQKSSELWLDLSYSTKSTLKSKLLKGINDLSVDCPNKIPILTRVVSIISTFEEWDELIPEIIDNVASIPVKLKILTMVN
eukprot:283597_1